METSQCPTTHPYAYLGGIECCKTQKEDNGVARKSKSINSTEEILSRQKRHPHTDVSCDGSTLNLESTCCENGAFIRCPAGDGKLCSDGNAAGIRIIK